MHPAELKTFFDHNRAFYFYYRSPMTQVDTLYRDKNNVGIIIQENVDFRKVYCQTERLGLILRI